MHHFPGTPYVHAVAAALALVFTSPAISAETPRAVPEEAQSLVAKYRDAVQAQDWENYRALFCLDPRGRLQRGAAWAGKQQASFTVGKTELLYAEADLIILRLSLDALWTEYRPAVLTTEVSLLVLRKEQADWKIWNGTELFSGKKG